MTDETRELLREALTELRGVISLEGECPCCMGAEVQLTENDYTHIETCHYGALITRLESRLADPEVERETVATAMWGSKDDPYFGNRWYWQWLPDIPVPQKGQSLILEKP